jgi:hypothetical protein
MDDFSLARLAGHLIIGDGSGPDGLAKKDGAKALSGAESVDTATTQLDKPSRTKNLIIECIDHHGIAWVILTQEGLALFRAWLRSRGGDSTLCSS